MYAAPRSTPGTPYGMKGCQFAVLMWRAPRMITKSTTASLRITMAALNPALSRMPITSTTVTSSTMTKAGRFMIAPVATHPSAGSKSKGLPIHAAGRTMPKMPRKETK